MKALVLVLLMILALAGAWLSFNHSTNQSRPKVTEVKVDPRPVNRNAHFTTSFSDIISNAAPSVVNIFSIRAIQAEPNNPLADLFGGRRRGLRARNLGSGVIISEEGYILTNNHVVDQADEIHVSFADDTRSFRATVVGVDPPTDLAVIKIEGEDLPAITVADSDRLAVGDVVLAIGNPFGVGQTVTMGIVGAVGRGGFGIVDYEDFIQTDASINPGNSGGALIDAEGRLVGINTAILSRTGGNHGLGFSIPINMARAVMEKIIQEGRVVRGYMGVALQDNSREIARAFRVPENGGAMVASVLPGSPADTANLRRGDLIVEFNGMQVNNSRHLRLMAAQTSPNTPATIVFNRAGKRHKVDLILEEMPQVPLEEEEQ
ncbi:MAG: S1C family serine protease [Limisphaerales bacterium]